MDKFLEVLLESLKDTAMIVPILFLVYVLIEVIENKSASKLGKYKLLKNKFSPIIGSVIGVIPQCGFSVVATDLYSEKHASMGTLLAVYLATSDEAIPILISTPSSIHFILPLLLIKVGYSIIIGYLVDFFVGVYKKKQLAKVRNAWKNEKQELHTDVIRQEVMIEDVKSVNKENLITTPFVIEIKETPEKHIGCCGHNIEKDPSTFTKFILHPLIHILKICLFVFIINLTVGLLLTWVGIDILKNFMLTDSIFQPLIFGLVGLIPNCASSVLITELFIEGVASFGSCVAGLCVNAGIALTVLFKQNRNIKENFLILGILYLAGTFIGMILTLF